MFIDDWCVIFVPHNCIAGLYCNHCSVFLLVCLDLLPSKFKMLLVRTVVTNALTTLVTILCILWSVYCVFHVESCLENAMHTGSFIFVVVENVHTVMMRVPVKVTEFG